MRDNFFINQGVVTVEVHTQLKNASSNIEMVRVIINHPSIHVTIIIRVMNIMVGNQIRASDVYQRIILSQIFRNRELWIRNFTETKKSLKLVCADRKR